VGVVVVVAAAAAVVVVVVVVVLGRTYYLSTDSATLNLSDSLRMLHHHHVYNC
jgi:hypothetical protein